MPATVDESKVFAAIDLYAGGLPITNACKQAGISHQTLVDRCKSSDIVRSAWNAAHEMHAAALVAQSIDVAAQDPDPQRSRVRMQAFQWAASRVDRKNWGDRVDIQVEQKVSITAALEAAEQRLRLGSDLIIDGAAQVIEDKALIEARSTDSQSDSALPDPFD
jgi:hypothetical protein